MKMIIRSYKAQKLKKGSFLVQFQKKLLKVCLFSASFSSVGCISDVVLLEKDKNRIPSLDVGLVQVKKWRQQRTVHAQNSMVNLLKLWISFYLGDSRSLRRQINNTNGWSKFKDLLPLLTNRSLTFGDRGKLYSAYMPSVVLYWNQMSVQEDDIIKLEKNDAIMVRKM